MKVFNLSELNLRKANQLELLGQLMTIEEPSNEFINAYECGLDDGTFCLCVCIFCDDILVTSRFSNDTVEGELLLIHRLLCT